MYLSATFAHVARLSVVFCEETVSFINQTSDQKFVESRVVTLRAYATGQRSIMHFHLAVVTSEFRNSNLYIQSLSNNEAQVDMHCIRHEH